jgi:hypothetical protein
MYNGQGKKPLHPLRVEDNYMSGILAGNPHTVSTGDIARVREMFAGNKD